MKRLLMFLTVALIMAAMVVAMALPAFAGQPNPGTRGGGPGSGGSGTPGTCIEQQGNNGLVVSNHRGNCEHSNAG